MMLVLVMVLVEISIIVLMVLDRGVGTWEAVLGVVNTTGLALVYKPFYDLLRRTFLPDLQAAPAGTAAVESQDLARYFHWREQAVRQNGDLGSPEVCQSMTVELLRAVLKFMEAILKVWIGPHRYELSIFADPVAPEIICYYDSDGNVLPRSDAARRADPLYYRKEKYEVVELLERPSNRIHVISRTHEDEDYSFANPRQTQEIRSTILCSILLDSPVALVVVCNKEGTFGEEDVRLHGLISALATALRADLELKKRLPAATAS
jgi:hypothetical protein